MWTGRGADTRFGARSDMDGGHHECRDGCRHVVDGADGLVGGEVDTDIMPV